jgi:hypothetical protein
MYAVYLADDSAGTTKSQLQSDLASGAETSAFVVSSNTAIGTAQYLLVYLRDTSNSLHDLAYICLKDNPSASERYFYAVTNGLSNANNAATVLVTGCHALNHEIVIERVATAVWDNSGSNVVETTFDDTEANPSYSVFFPTGSSESDIQSALNPYQSTAPIPWVYTGTGANSLYSIGVIQAASVIDNFVPNRPDPDIARYIARSAIHFRTAGAAIINRAGYVRIQTKTSAKDAVKNMANMYIQSNALTFEFISGASATITALDTAVSQTSALCYQVSGADSQPSCISPYTV